MVVVDQGSGDDTPARVRRAYPSVQVVALDGDRGAAGRNAGVEAVDARYIAFCDDDSWWAPGALRRAAAVLDANPDVAVIAARVLLNEDQRLDPACAAMAASPLPRMAEGTGNSVLGFVACGAIVRRTAFLGAGGFHPAWALARKSSCLPSTWPPRAGSWSTATTSWPTTIPRRGAIAAGAARSRCATSCGSRGCGVTPASLPA